jgi:hypothetical protein
MDETVFIPEDTATIFYKIKGSVKCDELQLTNIYVTYQVDKIKEACSFLFV